MRGDWPPVKTASQVQFCVTSVRRYPSNQFGLLFIIKSPFPPKKRLKK